VKAAWITGKCGVGQRITVCGGVDQEVE